MARQEIGRQATRIRNPFSVEVVSAVQRWITILNAFGPERTT